MPRPLVHFEHTKNQKTSFRRSSQYKVHDASGRNEDVLRFERNILVVGNEERNSRIRVKMPTMSTSQGETSKTGGTTTISTNTKMEIRSHYYGFRRPITELAMGL